MTREVEALKDEYSRIVCSTTFNGKQLLADSSATHLQLGIDSSANSRLSVTTSIVSSTVGDGTFQAEVNITASGSNAAVASGDFNRDGNAGIVTLGSGRGGFSISLGNAVNSSSISGLDVSSASAARSTLDQSLVVLSRLATSLGALGAAQSRLAASAANLASGRENTLQAESRIRDVDVADQSGELTRLNLLQQVGAQVLEQANRLPALALQLLKN